MPYQLCNLQIFYSVGCLFIFLDGFLCCAELLTLFLWRRKWHPTPVLLPGKSHGRRSLISYSPCGCKESDTTERLHLTSLHCSFCSLCSKHMGFLVVPRIVLASSKFRAFALAVPSTWALLGIPISHSFKSWLTCPLLTEVFLITQFQFVINL